MGTGPRADAGFDLALTELLPPDGGEPTYLVEVGSERGAEVLADVPTAPAGDAETAEADRRLRGAADRMGRTLEVRGLAEALLAAPDHPRWDAVAERCLACGNCTLACPTCFCTTVEDTTDLTGAFAERTRLWDSCFTLDLSYIHGGPVRPSMRARYRQWATHKLATWEAQFGTAGCVGCGRCITWCPAAIDLTEEATAIAASAPRNAARVGARPTAWPAKEATDAAHAR
jgi:ferredoxin